MTMVFFVYQTVPRVGDVSFVLVLDTSRSRRSLDSSVRQDYRCLRSDSPVSRSSVVVSFDPTLQVETT